MEVGRVAKSMRNALGLNVSAANTVVVINNDYRESFRGRKFTGTIGVHGSGTAIRISTKLTLDANTANSNQPHS